CDCVLYRLASLLSPFNSLFTDGLRALSSLLADGLCTFGCLFANRLCAFARLLDNGLAAFDCLRAYLFSFVAYEPGCFGYIVAGLSQNIVQVIRVQFSLFAGSVIDGRGTLSAARGDDDFREVRVV